MATTKSKKKQLVQKALLRVKPQHAKVLLKLVQLVKHQLLRKI